MKPPLPRSTRPLGPPCPSSPTCHHGASSKAAPPLLSPTLPGGPSATCHLSAPGSVLTSLSLRGLWKLFSDAPLSPHSGSGAFLGYSPSIQDLSLPKCVPHCTEMAFLSSVPPLSPSSGAKPHSSLHSQGIAYSVHSVHLSDEKYVTGGHPRDVIRPPEVSHIHTGMGSRPKQASGIQRVSDWSSPRRKDLGPQELSEQSHEQVPIRLDCIPEQSW